jgi:hypothetical protein
MTSWEDEPSYTEEDPEDEDFYTPGRRPAELDDAAETLDNLERFYERDREAFIRMAAVQDLGAELREALSVLLTLPPDAMRALTDIARMPVEDQQLIHRAISLPDEVRAALRGLLRD